MMPPLSLRYLLVIHIPLHVDARGRHWLDRLWAVDLLRHTSYIERLTVACPFTSKAPPADAVCIDGGAITFTPLPVPSRMAIAVLYSPWVFWRLWRLIGNADIVQSGLGGWLPLTATNLAAAIGRLRGKFLLTIVESSPWRLPPGRPVSALAKVKAACAEAVGRLRIRWVDFAVFTHQRYKEDLMLERPERGHVIHASWVEGRTILSEREARAQWGSRRVRSGTPVRFLFAARLTEAKGVRILLDAWSTLGDNGAPPDARLSIIGIGELLSFCNERAARSAGAIEVLDPVQYGEPFFALLRKFDAVVVPNLTDEQPRIVYDAYSQAVPVIGFATDGLKDCIRDGVTGRLCKPGDRHALAELMAWASEHRNVLEEMGIAALTAARSMTHEEMHRHRHELLSAAIASSSRTPSVH